MATFLAKLPLRVVRNEINLLYTLIKTLLYVGVHPLRASVEAAELLVHLIDQLTKPEAWTKIGAGVTGGGIGQSLVSGNPLSLIAIGVGGALMVSGLSVGALKAAVKAPEDQKLQAALDNFFSQVKGVPEALLTGLTNGVISGAIQKIYAQEIGIPEAKEAAIKEAVYKQLSEQGLPVDQIQGIVIDPQGNITVDWIGRSSNGFLSEDNVIVELFMRKQTLFGEQFPEPYGFFQKVTTTITSESATFQIQMGHWMNYTSPDHRWVEYVTRGVDTSAFGFHFDYPNYTIDYTAIPQPASHVGFAVNALQETDVSLQPIDLESGILKQKKQELAELQQKIPTLTQWELLELHVSASERKAKLLANITDEAFIQEVQEVFQNLPDLKMDPNDYQCPILSDWTDDPVLVYPSYRIYDRTAISIWRRTNNLDPITKENITEVVSLPNKLKEKIQAIKEEESKKNASEAAA